MERVTDEYERLFYNLLRRPLPMRLAVDAATGTRGLAMKPRFEPDFVLFMFLADLALTDLALWIARTLRFHLPLGQDVVRRVSPNFDFPLWLYLVVPAIWATVFLALRVYDGRRDRAIGGSMQLVAGAVAFATLVLAGLVYFSIRELSRLLFLYFALADLVLLAAWRCLLRLAPRWGRAGWPGAAGGSSSPAREPCGKRIGRPCRIIAGPGSNWSALWQMRRMTARTGRAVASTGPGSAKRRAL